MISQQLLSQKLTQIAPVFSKHALVQKTVGQRLLARLDYITITPKNILEINLPISLFETALQKRFPKAHFQSHALAQEDFNSLRSFANTFDFIFSNCVLPWILDTPAFLKTIHHILAPNGLWLFSSFGSNTLHQLKQAWQTLDPLVHINPFADLQTIGDLLLKAQFCDPVVDTQTLTIRYQNLTQLLQDLKNTGCCILKRPDLGLHNPSYFSALDNKLPKPLEMDYELMYGIGWKSKHPSIPLNLNLKLGVQSDV